MTRDFERPLCDPRHPLWPLLRFTFLLAAITFLLYGEANNFDETELRVITQFAPVLIGGKLLNDKLSSRLKDRCREIGHNPEDG